MKKLLTFLLLSVTTTLGFASNGNSHATSVQSSYPEMGNDGSIIDYLQKNQYDDNTNFIISVVPSAVQPTFTMAYFTDLAFNIENEQNENSGIISYKTKSLPADYRFGLAGQLSYLLPTDTYLDLLYNYYGISMSASDKINDSTADASTDYIFSGSGGIHGQYHSGEFYFRTRIALLNLLGKYFHNDASFGFSFQNLNLHHHNHVNNIRFEDIYGTSGDLSFKSKQKHKVFGFGPSVKWLTTIDLLPLSLRPHNLSFISEAKFSLLYARYYGKGVASLNGTIGSDENDGGETKNNEFSARWRAPTTYFVVLNTNLKAGLLYAYRDFSLEFAYKILYFSDEDYNVSDFLRGTLAKGVIPDLTALLNVFPTNIGFRAYEVALNYKF